MTESASAPNDHDLIARPGRYYRNARYIIVAMALLGGLWFAYDGFINYPRERAEFLKLPEDKRGDYHKPHSEFDILLQQRLAIGLILAAPVLLAFFLYRSRGVYRLSGNTLYVPGHPPVPFENMAALDKSKWQRKGIAYVNYKIPDSQKTTRLTLDDFIYDQTPTDQIVARIEEHLKPAEDSESAELVDEAAVDEDH